MRCVVMLLCLQASNVIIAVSGIFEESKNGFDGVVLVMMFHIDASLGSPYPD